MRLSAVGVASLVFVVAVITSSVGRAAIWCMGDSEFRDTCESEVEKVCTCGAALSGFAELCSDSTEKITLVFEGKGCIGPHSATADRIGAGLSQVYWDPDATCVDKEPAACMPPYIVLGHEIGHAVDFYGSTFDSSPSGPPGSVCGEVRWFEHEAVRVQNAILMECPTSQGCCARTQYGFCVVDDPYRHTTVFNITDPGQTWIQNGCDNPRYEVMPGEFTYDYACLPGPQTATRVTVELSNHEIVFDVHLYSDQSLHGTGVGNEPGGGPFGDGQPVRFNLPQPQAFEGIPEITGYQYGGSFRVFLNGVDHVGGVHNYELGAGVFSLPPGDYALYFSGGTGGINTINSRFTLRPASFCPVAN